ncbi:phosphoglycolate phosphatase [Loktanella sp. DSM 29012]|uniref:HAD-IA family hydrolase n=1 Tax=Loktanella sp. DSM 29012 TaxID=1881056 RepID=UPI0008D8D448|nr:HAD-IA family hydrolase [Loktanella sp. DSM 29012]SEQ37051.1 phosphoglycolate phosphatase [Loktanella sp. DSM 29012]
MDLRLVIFDVDGTLVNSRAAIVHAMRAGFAAVGRDYPGDAACLRGVGLSVDVMFRALVPDAPDTELVALRSAYQQAYYDHRASLGSEAMAPFYDGARDALDRFRAQDTLLMAAATGKSLRGMQAMIADHGLVGYFQSVQTADHHPSKPHPSMIHQVLSDTGVEPARAVMVGDTSFDMQMGRAAGVATIGVSWGYHPPEALDADRIITDFAQLDAAVDALTGGHP